MGNGFRRRSFEPAVLLLACAALLLPASAFGAARTLTLSPADAVVAVGGGEYLLPIYDPDGSGSGIPQFPDPSLVRWSSSNRLVVAVDARGGLRARSAGTATITARYRRLIARATITVAGTQSTASLVTPDQRTRTYTLYVPAGYRATEPLPLVLAYHGEGGSGLDMMHVTQWNALAHQYNILVAYPDGTGASRSWNGGGCCGQAAADRVDDVTFTRMMIADVQSRVSVDARRVYAAGFSSGGVMVNRLAVELSDRITAVASVSGEIAPGGDFVLTSSGRPVSIMMFHGTTDQRAPYDPARMDRIVQWWVTRNALTGLPPTVSFQRGIETCQSYASATVDVTWCIGDPPNPIEADGIVYDGGGHAWPGGAIAFAGADLPTFDIDASEAIWNFLERFTLP